MQKIRLVGVSADIFEYNQETGEQGDHITAKDINYLNTEGTIEHINSALAIFQLPPLNEWGNRYAEDVDAEPGYYEISVFENEDGAVVDDGEYFVDYLIKLEKLEVESLDLRELTK